MRRGSATRPGAPHSLRLIRRIDYKKKKKKHDREMQQNSCRVELNGFSVELDGTIHHGETAHHREVAHAGFPGFSA